MAAARPQVLSLIAAVAANGAIGRDNDLLWHDSRDQKHFRATTLGCPVIMGRRTWDSLPERFRPLPGRRNIVITRNTHWQAPGAEVAHSLDEALALVAEASGASAHFESHPLQRAVRDVNTLSAHTVFDLDQRLEDYGRTVLGLEPRGLF